MTNFKMKENMSQVRKLLNGNKVPKYRYGHLIINGIDLGNSEDIYQQFAQHGKNQDPGQSKAYAAWLQQLANGEDVIIGIDNSTNVHPEDMTDKRAGKRNVVEKVIDDIFNTDRNQFSDATVTAGRFTPVIQPKKKNSKNNSAANFVFVGDTPVYDERDSNNLALKERFDEYLNWLTDDLWEEDNQFSTALTENQKSALRAWYNSLDGNNPYEKRQAALKQWDENIAKVKAAENGYNSVDEKARNFFANFNIGNASTSEASSGTDNSSEKASEKKTRETLQKAGYNPDLYKLIGDNFEIDDEGVLRSKSGDFGLGIGNAYFNDDFYKSVYGAEGRFNALKGLTMYNGALYRNDSARLAAILNAEGGFNDLYKKGDFEGADRIIQTRWTDREKEPVKTLEPDDYSTWITPGMQFSNMTGRLVLRDESQRRNGDQIIQYIDPDSLSYDGGYAHYNYKFALLDDRGNFLRDLSKDDLEELINGISAGKLNTYKRTPISQGSYANTFYEDITGLNGQPSGIRIYRDIKDKDGNVILQIGGLKGYASGKNIKLPREVAEILMKDRSWIEKILKNPQAKMNFTEALSSLVEDKTYSKTWEGRRKWLGWGINPINWFSNDVDYKISKLNDFLNKDSAEKLRDALIQASKGNKWERRENYILDPAEFRNGGKIQYITKLAGGGFTGGTTGSQGSSETRIQSKVSDPRNAAGFGDLGTKNWTTADTKDLLAFFGDVSSLGLAFVPGANIASTATGVASSLARYSADKDRGTKGAGWQLGLNLAMDAATLIPFLGGAAKSGKVGKGVKAAESLLKKAAKVIITGASAWGLGNAVVTSASKIANNEKFTVRDVANVVNGITAGVGIARSGSLGNPNKKVDAISDVNIKGKSGVEGAVEVKLDGVELSNVSTPKEFKEAVVAAAKRNGDTNVTLENVAERYNLSEFISGKNKWKPGWSPKNWGRKEKTDYLNKLKTHETTQTEEANGNLLHDWWYGLGNTQRTYHAARYNEPVLGQNNIPGKITSRIDVAEAPGTVSGARYYQDEFGTWYRTNPSKTVDASAAQVARARTLPQRRAINNREGFTGRVKVFEGATDPFSHTWYYPRIGVANPNIFLPLQLDGRSYEYPSGFIPRYGYYKKGGVVKAQNGLPSYESRKIFDSVYDPNAGLEGFDKFADEEYRKNYIATVENSNLPEAHKRRLIAELRSKAPVQTTGPFADSNIDTSGALEQIGKGVLGAAEYGVKAVGRKKVADTQIKGLQDANYSDQYVPIEYYDTRDPYSEAEIQALGQLNANPNINPNADYTAYVAGLLAKQAQILPAINKAYRQASQSLAQKKAANTDLHNKKNLMDQEVDSKNAARNAGTKMNIANVKSSLQMQDAMSLANAIREMRANTETELEKAKQFAFNRDAQQVNDKYEALWKNAIGPKYSEWTNLDQAVKDNYSDINDWLQRADSNKEWWKLNEEAWNSNQRALNDELQKLYMKYSLSPMAQMLYRQRYMKKGGRIGRNRYKNEPEEDVWINQNKAVHKAVAKLNDNIIKIFLKTLG